MPSNTESPVAEPTPISAAAAEEGGAAESEGSAESAAESAAEAVEPAANEPTKAERKAAKAARKAAKEAAKEAAKQAKRAARAQAREESAGRKESRGDKRSAKVEFERSLGREEAVAYFSSIVDGLRAGTIAFHRGEQRVAFTDMPEQVELEVTAVQKGDKAKIGFEISWRESARHGLSIVAEVSDD